MSPSVENILINARDMQRTASFNANSPPLNSDR